MSGQTTTASLDTIVAVVTGGSRGIGLAIASALVSKGARVVITGRDQASLDEATTTLGSSAHAVRADVSKPEEAGQAIEAAVERFGGLDLLVNNAGIGLFASVADMSIGSWQQIIDTNLSGVFYCCHAAIPHLRRRGNGWIINISSLAGANPFVGGAAYCASKAGVNAFSEALMQEVRYDNIRVSYIMPGSVATGFSGSPSSSATAESRRSPSGAQAERGDSGVAEWKVAPNDVADLVLELVTFPSRSLPSRIELRPSRPPKK